MVAARLKGLGIASKNPEISQGRGTQVLRCFPDMEVHRAFEMGSATKCRVKLPHDLIILLTRRLTLTSERLKNMPIDKTLISRLIQPPC